MRIAQYTLEDMPMLNSWWDGHKHPTVPFEILPDVGIIAYDDENTPLAFGVLYACNSAPIGWIEWITSNPEVSAFASYRGVSTVLDFLCLEAKKSGINVLMSTCRQKSLGKVLSKNGFAQTDESVSHYLKLITY